MGGTMIYASADELHGYRNLLVPDEGPTLADRLAELHDLLCTISARIDDEHAIWDDVQTAIDRASALTDEAQAVTP